MVLISRPVSTMAIVFSGGPPLTKLSTSSASTIRPNSAAGPICSMSFANGGANSISPTTLTVPPMKLPIAAIISAGPARPCIAMAWPSIQVMIDAASPGIRTRIDVVDPPYMAP